MNARRKRRSGKETHDSFKLYNMVICGDVNIHESMSVGF